MKGTRKDVSLKCLSLPQSQTSSSWPSLNAYSGTVLRLFPLSFLTDFKGGTITEEEADATCPWPHSCPVGEPGTALIEYRPPGSELGSPLPPPAASSSPAGGQLGIVVQTKDPRGPPGPSSAVNQVRRNYSIKGGSKISASVKFLDKVTHSQVARESLAPGMATPPPREDVPFTCTVSS